MINSILIALLWLSVIVPPLLDGSIYPDILQHYTTLIVQGFDLGLLLPLAFVAGWQWNRGKMIGWHLGPVYIVFLGILMTALSAKIIAMRLSGVNIIPSVFIIPTIRSFLAVHQGIVRSPQILYILKKGIIIAQHRLSIR